MVAPKVDFKKQLKHLYQPGTRDFQLVEVPPMGFLMIDGRGDPNEAEAYREAIEALFGTAYTIKFSSKIELGRDYVVPPLEGLWWADDMDAFVTRDKSAWQWTMMIMQPEWITAEIFEDARSKLAGKKDVPALPRLRLETYDEGLSAQILHLGSYEDEGPTIARMHEVFMPENGLGPRGRHHEIYLSDPRKVAPEKLKTVLRQPVVRLEQV